MLDFRLFAVKSMKFSTNPVFKNPGIYIFSIIVLYYLQAKSHLVGKTMNKVINKVNIIIIIT